MAGHFASLGHNVTLYNRSIGKLLGLTENGSIQLKGAISGFGKIVLVTDNLQEALKDAELIMVTTTADAHKQLAETMAPYVQEEQVIILNPGRTLGALEFSVAIKKITNKRIYIAEAQSLIYACRADTPGIVRVIGVKDKVLLAAYPASDTDRVLNMVNSVYSCFVKVDNILVTGLENIGAIFHPSVVLFNAAAIERGEKFYFYNDMTPSIANFLIEIDQERLDVGKAFGIQLHSVSDWVSLAYTNIEGEDLCEKMRNNPAYYQIQAPGQLKSRLLTEDVPTGILPIMELGKAAGLKMPLMSSVFTLSEGLLKIDFRSQGRTLKNLGLDKLSVSRISELVGHQ